MKKGEFTAEKWRIPQKSHFVALILSKPIPFVKVVISIKRILPLLLIVLVMISSMASSVFAAESYQFAYDASYGMSYVGVDIPEGRYYASLMYDGILVFKTGAFRVTFTESNDQTIFVQDLVFIKIDDSSVAQTYRLALGKRPAYPGITGGYLYFGNNDVLTDEDLTLVLTEIPAVKRTMVGSISEALTNTINWSSAVVNSLMSGDLSPLLAVFALPIAIAAMFFAVKVLRSFAWGS